MRTLLDECVSIYPGFTKFVDDDEGYYNIFGDFAIYARKLAKNYNNNKSEMEYIVKIINHLANKNSSEIDNILLVGIFEVIGDELESKKVIQSLIGEKALTLWLRYDEYL